MHVRPWAPHGVVRTTDQRIGIPSLALESSIVEHGSAEAASP